VIRTAFLGLVILLGTPSSLLAGHVHWMGDYNRALQKAMASHKPLLVLVTKARHKPSARIVKNIFMNQPYVETINRRCVPVMVIYAHTPQYPVEMYYTRTFPTLFMVNPVSELALHPPLYGDAINQISTLLPKLLSAPSFQAGHP